jgi:antirestriction protein ArdC
MKTVAYEAVYNQITKKMEDGIIPWKKPWKSYRPCNAKTGRPYNGINFILLSMTDFSDNRWITYNQLQELGGNVKKGQKSTQVVFWQILNKEEDGKKKLMLATPPAALPACRTGWTPVFPPEEG